MKECPQCGAKNKESNKFCKKCGQVLVSSSFQDKKEKVVGKKGPARIWILGAVALAAVAGGYFYFSYSPQAGESKNSQPPVSSAGQSSAAGVAEAGKRIDMTDVKATLKDGYLQFTLAEVKNKGLIYCEYQKGGKKIPLTAYISPQGKLVTAVSMCEPCRSTRFHIEGSNLVCNSCNTVWTLEELKGISGGCLKYPPEVIAHTLEGDKIKIKETDILAWKPRA
jgi:hypothetical protein